MTMSEPETVFDYITNAGENKEAIYVEKLGEIFAHAKNEIVEFNEKLGNELLLSLRNALFVKLLELLPKYIGFDLYCRRKTNLIAEDVYILGYCVVSGLEDRRLKNILKCDPNKSVLSQEDGVTNAEDLDIIHTCITLKNSVATLVNQVKCLVTHVEVLENEITSMKLLVQHPSNKDSVVESSGSSDSSDTESGSEETVNTDEAESANNVAPNVPMNMTQAQNTQTSPVAAFRHSSQERRRIRRGRSNKHQKQSVKHNVTPAGQSDSNSTPPAQSDTTARRAQTRVPISNVPMVGSSLKSHRIEAAAVSDRRTKPAENIHRVYAGRLSSSTSEDAIRAHLADVGLQNSDIADVVKLKCRNLNESSFCISLNSKVAENKIYDSSLWPEGIRIRPFNSPSPRSKIRRFPQLHSSWHREHQIPRQRVRRSSDRQWYNKSASFHTGHQESYGYDEQYYNDYGSDGYYLPEDKREHWSYQY